MGYRFTTVKITILDKNIDISIVFLNFHNGFKSPSHDPFFSDIYGIFSYKMAQTQNYSCQDVQGLQY